MAEQHHAAGSDTRTEVMRALLTLGPVTATDIAAQLGLSAAGVRRHLDKLIESELAETCGPRAIAGEEATRGRPAKHFRLTDSGRRSFGTQYDDLAVEAVEMIKTLGGETAVRDFARARIDKILQGVDRAHGADTSPEGDSEAARTQATVEAVAEVLDQHGYAATVTAVGNGIQLCQHHCPVSEVASAHPEICEAEHEAISALVGKHVQPLALIADGNGICTTNIPLAATATAAGTINERSGDYDES